MKKQAPQVNTVMPRSRLRRFILEHANEAKKVRKMNDGSKAMNILCTLLDNPWCDQREVAEQYKVGIQYISQVMRDVEVIGTPLDYAKRRSAGIPVTRSRSRQPGVAPKRTRYARALTDNQRKQATAIVKDTKQSTTSKCRAAALLMIADNPKLTYKQIAEAVSEKYKTKMQVHQVVHTLYTLQYVNKVDAVCHGRLYGSLRDFEQVKQVKTKQVKPKTKQIKAKQAKKK